jgi:CheY-like chemotaxis protein
MAERSPGEKVILIADDDSSLVTALAVRLRAWGFTVIEAYDGEEAYRQAVDNKPDVVLMDIKMPEASGITCLDRMRHSIGTRGIPVIFITAFDDDETIAQTKALGAAGFFRKPFDDNELKNAIDEVIGR